MGGLSLLEETGGRGFVHELADDDLQLWDGGYVSVVALQTREGERTGFRNDEERRRPRSWLVSVHPYIIDSGSTSRGQLQSEGDMHKQRGGLLVILVVVEVDWFTVKVLILALRGWYWVFLGVRLVSRDDEISFSVDVDGVSLEHRPETVEDLCFMAFIFSMDESREINAQSKGRSLEDAPRIPREEDECANVVDSPEGVAALRSTCRARRNLRRHCEVVERKQQVSSGLEDDLGGLLRLHVACKCKIRELVA